MLKLSLEDGIKAETKELAESKKEKAMAEEKNAEAAGNLERSKKEIAADEVELTPRNPLLKAGECSRCL